LLLLFFAFVFGWNNSGLTTGNLSNLVTYRLSLSLTLAGMFVGFFAAGSTMSSSILGKLVPKAMPTSELFSAVAVSLGMLLVLTILKLPVSLSNCTVGAFVGSALVGGSQVNAPSLVEIIASWIIVPFACAFLSFGIYEIAIKVEQHRPLVSVIRLNRVALVVVVFFVSFILGANNLGMIESLATAEIGNSLTLVFFELILFASAAVGIVLFGRTLAEVVSDKIVGLSQIKTFAAMLSAALVIFVLTTFSIPVSLTQVIIGGMLGAGVSRRPWAVNSREIGLLVAGWALVTVTSAGLGFLVAHFA
jgi:inorganic phosphate transporter, PiT family